MIFSSSSPLLNRIIFRTFLIAFGFGFITIGLTFYAGYRYQVSEVENHLQLLVESQHDILVTNIWNFDDSSVSEQLNGMLSHPDIYYIELELSDEVLHKGNPKLKGLQGGINEYELVRQTGKGKFHLGILRVFVTYDHVIKRIQYGYLSISIVLAGALFVISVLTYLLFHKLFYRHLNRIVSFAQDLELTTLGTPLYLQRKRPVTQSGDELQLITDTLNDMRQRLLDGLHEKKILQEDRILLEQVIEQSYNSILITDDNWHIRYVNRAILNRMGCSREEALDTDLATFLGFLPHTLPYSLVSRVIKTGRTWSNHIANTTDDDRHTEEDIRITAIQSEKGGKTHYVVVITDVTKEWALEKQLLQAQKMESIGTLAGGIAHDFNNLLSVILGYAELIQVKAGDDTFGRETEQIVQAGSRAKALVKQILTFSRETETEFKPVLLQWILHEVNEMLTVSLPSSINFTMHIDQTVPAVSADESQLHQVIMNLCTNAKQALLDDKGSIKVSLETRNVTAGKAKHDRETLHPGNYAVITVKDNGCGMDEAVLSRIFDPFYTTKTQNEGTGLGLSVVHGIVKKHKGDIRVSSKPGEGTVFELLIPTAKGSRKSLEKEDEPLPGGNERIMIVDDDFSVLEMLWSGLTVLGYKTSTFNRPGEALIAFLQDPEKIDLVITDMTMPEMTGDVLAMRLREAVPRLPIILCTGYSEHIDESRAADLAIDSFILKPVVTSELARTVRDVLD